MVTYKFIDEIILIVFEGVVNNRQLLEGQHDLFEEPLFRGSSPRLVDATDCTDMQFTDSIVRHVAKEAYARGLRRAALVSSKSKAVFGLMRMYAEYHGEDAKVEVFSDQTTAIQWLRGDTGFNGSGDNPVHGTAS